MLRRTCNTPHFGEAPVRTPDVRLHERDCEHKAKEQRQRVHVVALEWPPGQGAEGGTKARIRCRRQGNIHDAVLLL